MISVIIPGTLSVPRKVRGTWACHPIPPGEQVTQ